LFDKVLETIDAGGLDFALYVSKQSSVNLNETHVRNLLSERLGQIGEVLAQGQSHPPALVLGGSDNDWQHVRFVLVLVKQLHDLLERVQADDAHGVLVVLREFAEQRDQFVRQIFFLDDVREVLK